MAGASYNITRFTRQVLKRHRKEPPSLVLHLYPTHFRFEQQVSVAIESASVRRLVHYNSPPLTLDLHHSMATSTTIHR
jgi:hypothetical protein